jgi:ankyrin repeat protein
LFQIEAMKILMMNGATPDFVFHNRTALYTAVWGESLDAVNLLIEKKCSPNIISANDDTPLHLACQKGNLAIVNALLSAGANPNLCSDKSRVTPLFMLLYATKQKDCEKIVASLIRAGADVNHLARKKRTILHDSCIQKKPAILASVISYATNIDGLDEESKSPLLLAMEHSDIECAALLLSNGATFPENFRLKRLGVNLSSDQMAALEQKVQVPYNRLLQTLVSIMTTSPTDICNLIASYLVLDGRGLRSLLAKIT